MTSTLPEEAVKAACDAYKLEDDRLSGIGMMRALEAAAPFLPAQVAVKKLDLTVLERLAENAEQYDHPDDNGPFPDIQDAMVTVGDLRQARKLLSILSALEPSAARELALEDEEFAIDKLRFRAFHTNSDTDRQAYFDAVSKWFQDRHIRRMNAERALPSPHHADAGKVEGEGSFQSRVKPWMLACFGEEISNDKLERCDRFIEEALELVQAIGYSPDRAHALVDYVFNREIGEPHQEVGGVMVTLAALCLAAGLDMDKAGEDELARIWTKVEKIRAKQAAKPTGSALPIPSAPASEGAE